MKSVLVISLVVGLTAAANPQQRSPVYQPRDVSGSNVGGGVGGNGANGGLSPTLQQSVNSFISKSSPALPPTPTVSTSVSPLPVVAEARESVVSSDASMLQHESSVNTGTPSQNYYVYYYPNQPGQVGTAGQPNSSRIMSMESWYDVLVGVGAVAFVGSGMAILYSQYGQQAQTRALRELKDMTAEDAARMARGVLRALEKFSTLNNYTE